VEQPTVLPPPPPPTALELAIAALVADNGTGDNGQSLALNLDGISDFTEVIYIDRARQARGWQNSSFAATPSANLNSEKALASLPGTDTTQQFFFNAHGSDPTGQWGGRFRMTFTGAATVNLSAAGTNIVQINANTYEFDCDYAGNKWITFTPTAFPIKVSIVKTTDLTAHAGGQIFRDQFLNFIPTGTCLRFMNSTKINNSTLTNWSDHNTLDWQTWEIMPYAAMVNLCNARMADPWICIPHRATDDYITQLATYLRDNLNTSLLIRLEYSNEVWNFQFQQAGWLELAAEAEWTGVDGNGGAWMDWAGKRFAQMMQIFNTVFAGQTNRLSGVIAGQGAGAGLSSRILDAPEWQTRDPANYVAPYTRAKEYAIADYIGFPGGAPTTAAGNAIKAALDVSHAAAVQAVKDQFPTGLALSKGFINNAAILAAARNLRLSVYEYNNHLDLNNPPLQTSNLYSGGLPVAGALEAFVEATYSQEMADALDELRTYFKASGGTVKCLYKATAKASRFGTWGGVQWIGDNPLTWQALINFAAANPRHWSRTW
jgi:hypothetical protein